ncbi:hypothetical protein BRD00_14715 [Halobacteriales archaeon QS_8_69_26]|nr:MAG: hypothetical protein BRD00_14715 [Halobacteriales archaeon QS_8_69_26]
MDRPNAEFTFEAASDGVLRITHSGGDTFVRETTKNLSIVVNGARVDRVPPPVRPNDSVTVPASADDSVRIVWYGDDPECSSVLDTYGPNGTTSAVAGR